ncbi:MAG: hypothetical protein ABIJ47_15190 [Candidatus Bathyarchaeota archaeon]
MWYNELLLVLMFTALIGMGIMALIVKVNMRQREDSIEIKTKVPEKIYEPEKNVRQEPTKIVEPEPEPAETIEISEALFKPIIIQAAEPEPTPEPTTEPLIITSWEETAEPVIEPLTETIDELIVEPPTSPTPEPQATPPEPSPKEMELRRETENQFFDLRYDYSSQNVAADSPTILDEAPSIDPEEEKEEPLPGVVTCPHCKSEVPQTLYCIYCGNTLTAKPLATAAR